MSCNKYKNLSLSDIECPICLDICLLPVTLPCNHVFCEYCLRNTVEHQAFNCPKCRKRIGNFLRKNKEIVNLKLWAAIQEQYPEEVRKKQNGEDGISECLSAESIPPKPRYVQGEIREEFEKSLLEMTKSERQKKEKEEEASALLIKEIEEEEKRIEEERRKQLLIDEELARSFANESDSQPVEIIMEQDSDKRKSTLIISKSKAFSTPKAKTPTRKLESFFQNLPTTSRGSSDDDSIGQEIHHFKPISTAPTTPPKLMPDGSSANSYVQPIMVQPNKNQFTSVVENIGTSTITAEAEESESAGPSNTSQDELLILARQNIEQMERDRQVALKLQRQWNLEEKKTLKRTYDLRCNDKKIKKKKRETANRQRTLCRVGCHLCK